MFPWQQWSVRWWSTERAVSLLRLSFLLRKSPHLWSAGQNRWRDRQAQEQTGRCWWNFPCFPPLFSKHIFQNSIVNRSRFYSLSAKKDSCISRNIRYAIHRWFIDIHESHYLRFARLYSFLIIRMLTNHTFVLTTPSWNITLLDKYYQMSSGLSTKFDFFIRKISAPLTNAYQSWVQNTLQL